MEGYSVNWFNYSSWVAVDTPADCPELVDKRCVIEFFVGYFVMSLCFLEFLCVLGLLSQDGIRSLPFTHSIGLNANSN